MLTPLQCNTGGSPLDGGSDDDDIFVEFALASCEHITLQTSGLQWRTELFGGELQLILLLFKLTFS